MVSGRIPDEPPNSLPGNPEPYARQHFLALNPAGSALGLVCAVLAVTPSLLPRTSLQQGALAAIAFALGYLIGVAVWALVHCLVTGRAPTFFGRRGWWILYALLWAASLSVVSALALRWQNEVRRLVRLPPLDGVDLASFLLTFLIVILLLLAVGKGVRALYGVIHRRTRMGLAVLLTMAMVAGVLGGLGLALTASVDQIYYARNAMPDVEVVEPGSAFRSAGPDSRIDWDSLGRHGAAFVGGGPSAEAISELTQQPALTPIRVYAGVKSAPTNDERAALVVAELERTGAFDRAVLVVATTTGSGWLEPQAVDAIEYLHGGDTAIATMQYAYTPSWMSFLFDPDAPVDAARTLFNAIEARWLALPEDSRPQLVVYGLSLGAHGGQSIFTDLDDLRNRTDGALLVGSPYNSELWQTLQAQRDPGSPAWQPILDDGRAVRWISQAGDEERLTGPWQEPRVLYLQHATDAVTWLSPALFLRPPEWLEDSQRSEDISPAMRWIPLVTTLQLIVDMVNGESVPASYGHNFGDVAVTGWQQVTPESGLDEAAVARIQAEIETYAPIPAYEQ